MKMLIPFSNKYWFAFLLNFIPYQIKLYIFELYTFVSTYNLDLWENMTGIWNESISRSNLIKPCKLVNSNLDICRFARHRSCKPCYSYPIPSFNIVSNPKQCNFKATVICKSLTLPLLVTYFCLNTVCQGFVCIQYNTIYSIVPIEKSVSCCTKNSCLYSSNNEKKSTTCKQSSTSAHTAQITQPVVRTPWCCYSLKQYYLHFQLRRVFQSSRIEDFMHRASQNRMKKKITKSVVKLTGLQSGMRRQPVKVPQKLTCRLGKVKRGWRRSQRGVVSRIKKPLTQPSSQRCPPRFFYHCTSDSEWQVPKCFNDSRVLTYFPVANLSRSARPHFMLGHSKCVSPAFNITEHRVAHWLPVHKQHIRQCRWELLPVCYTGSVLYCAYCMSVNVTVRSECLISSRRKEGPIVFTFI